MAFTDAQIRSAFKQTYEHVNATHYQGQLPAWGTFEFRVTESPRTLGCVHFRRSYLDGRLSIKQVDISNRLGSLAALADTTYHEIAHIATAICDNQRGHGYHWMRHVNKVGGAVPKRCTTMGDDVEHRHGDWLIFCPTCDKTFHYTKRTKNVQRALNGILKVRCPTGCGIVNYSARQV